MRQFHETIHNVTLRLQQLAQELLFDWRPDIRLNALNDDLAIYRPGFSFLTHPANNL
jgi:hypothetical protein